MKSKSFGAFLLAIIIVVTQGPAKAQSPSQNYSAVKGTIGATAAMYGAAAAAGVCTIVSAGMCGAVVGGIVLGGASATLGMFQPPNDTVNWHGGSAGQMPDEEDENYGFGGGGECSRLNGTPGSMGEPMFETFFCGN